MSRKDANSMNQNQPDYQRYTIEELQEVLESIDQAHYPERFREASLQLEAKLNALPVRHADTAIDEDLPIARPKWSEQHISTRLATGSFVLTLTAIPFAFLNDFMVSKSWTEDTGLLIWAVGLVQVGLWFTALFKDDKFARHLGQSWRGKLSVVTMPFLFFVMSLMAIDRGLPVALHMMSSTDRVEHVMRYEKTSGTKHCRQRIQIKDTTRLNALHLCLTKQQRDALSRSGKITVIGQRSDFGINVEDVKFASR